MLCRLAICTIQGLCIDLLQIWGEEALQFQEKLLNSSGLGDETYFPDSAFLSFQYPKMIAIGKEC